MYNVSFFAGPDISLGTKGASDRGWNPLPQQAVRSWSPKEAAKEAKGNVALQHWIKHIPLSSVETSIPLNIKEGTSPVVKLIPF